MNRLGDFSDIACSNSLRVFQQGAYSSPPAEKADSPDTVSAFIVLLVDLRSPFKKLIVSCSQPLPDQRIQFCRPQVHPDRSLRSLTTRL
jgi:hypothetical protein